MSHVFVSYAHSDKQTVDALVASLRERKREVWMDEDSLHPASRFMEVIVPAIHTCQAFLFTFSRNSAASRYCLEELACAYSSGTKIIPIWLEDPKSVDRIPVEIDGVAGIRWDAERMAATLNRLLEAIDVDADWHEARKRLLTAAEQWEKQEERTDLLLRGKAITDALDVVATAQSRKIQLLHVELAYVAKSQAQEAAELARERELRQKAVARQLAADAELILQTRPAELDLAVLLALESWRRFPKLQASHVLRTGLHLLPRRLALARHAGPVRDYCFNPDGTLVATGSEDGTAKVWDTATGAEVQSVDHGAAVTRVAFRDSEDLVTLGVDSTLRISRMDTGEEYRRFKVEPETTMITRNGRYAGWGTRHGSAYVLDLRSGREPMVLKHENRVTEVAISSDGEWAATLSVSVLMMGKPTIHMLWLWNLSGQSHCDLPLNGLPCYGIEFSPNSRFLIADGLRGVRVWEVASHRQLYSLQGHGPVVLSRDEKAIAYVGNRSASASGGVVASGCDLAIARATDGQTIRSFGEEQRIAAIDFFHGHDYVAAGTGSMVRVWESDTGREMGRIPHRGTVRHVAYSRAGRLMSVTDEGAVYFWRLRIDGIQEIDRMDGSIAGMAASPNGRYLAVIAGPEFMVFDCKTGKAIQRQRHRGRVRSIDIADDGYFVFSTEPTVMFSASGQEEVGASGFAIGSTGQAETWIPLNRIAAVAVSPTAEFVAVAGDYEVQLWSVRTRSRCSEWDVPGAVKKLIFDPRGRYLAIVSSENLWLANVCAEPSAPHLLKTTDSIADAAYGGDGRFFVLHAGGGVSIWDPNTKESIDGFEAGEPVTQLFPGPGFDQIVLAGASRCVVWSLKPRKIGFNVRHEGLLAMSGDRQRIAVLQEQGRETWICNLVEENVEARLYCYRTRFNQAAFIRNERVAVADDGGMRIEPIRGADLEEELSDRLGRQLTTDERERYLPDELSEQSQM